MQTSTIALGMDLGDRDDNHDDFILDALPRLTPLFRSSDSDVYRIATDTLCDLARDEETKHLILSTGALQDVIETLRHTQEGDKVRAALALLALWDEDEDIQHHLPTSVLQSLLEVLHCTEAVQNDQVATLLCSLCKREDLQQSLVSVGVIPLLESVMEKGNEDQQDCATIALWNLTQNGIMKPIVLSMKALPALVANLAKLYDEGEYSYKDTATSIPTYVQLFRDGTGELKDLALKLLISIIQQLGVDEIHRRIIEAGALQPLMDILRDDYRRRENALVLLQGLTLYHISNLFSAGALGALVAVMRDSTPKEKSTAAYLLEMILHHVRKTGISQVPTEDLDAIAELARDGSAATTARCFNALSYLARNSSNRQRILATDVISLAVRTLQGAYTSFRSSAVSLLSNLSVDGDGRTAVLASGAVPSLVGMLSGNSFGETEKAIFALANIARKSLKNTETIVASGGIEPLVSIAQKSGIEYLRQVVLLTLIALSIKSNHIKLKIAAAGIIPNLVDILRVGKEGKHSRFQKLLEFRALTLLKSLAVDDDNEIMIVAAGEINPIANLIPDDNADLAWLAITTLRNLAVEPMHKSAITTAEGCIEAMLSRMRGTDERLSMAALNTLRNLAIRSNDIKKVIIAKGGATDLIAIIQESDGQKRLQALSLFGELAIEPANKEQVGTVAVLEWLVIDGESGEVGKKP